MICVGVKMSRIGKELVRKLNKEIHLKESLQEYSDFMNQNYKEFAYIRLALLYDTFFEVLAETKEAQNMMNPSYNKVLQEEIKRVSMRSRRAGAMFCMLLAVAMKSTFERSYSMSM